MLPTLSKQVIGYYFIHCKHRPSIQPYHNNPLQWPCLKTYNVVVIHIIWDRLGPGKGSMWDSGGAWTIGNHSNKTQYYNSGFQPNSAKFLCWKVAKIMASPTCNWRASNSLGSQMWQSTFCCVPKCNQWWTWKTQQILLAVWWKTCIHLSSW